MATGQVGPTTRSSSRSGRRARALAIDALLLLGAAVMVAPLAWLLVTAVLPAREAFQLPPRWVPHPMTLDNARQVPSLIPFARMAWNSLLIATFVTVGACTTSALAAYAFSRLRFRGREGIFTLLLAALMVPTQLTVLPVFILMRHLHLVDTLTGVWLPFTVNVFGIFFLRQYFNSIPRELDEAAVIDGAGHLWILFRMLLPLSKPALSALAIFVFEASWNNFFWPYIFLSSPQKMTLPVGLVSLQGSVGGGPAVVVFAAVSMVVLPMLILFLFTQRAFVTSVATTGVRG